jgi:DNA-directed RNA polymerase subunit RPC12/RpoP
MSFFNEEQIKAMETGRYICSKCGAVMEFEDEWEDILICPECNHDVAVERYGCEDDEDYDALYPTYGEVMELMGYDDEDDDNGCNDYDNEEEYYGPK